MKKVILISLLLYCLSLHAFDLREQKLINIQSKVELPLKEIAKNDLVIFIAYSRDCPVGRKYIPTYNSMFQLIPQDKVSVLLLDLIKNDDLEKTQEEIKSYALNLPVYINPNLEIAKLLKLKIISEVVLYKQSTQEILYQGALNNQFTLDLTREKADKNYLQDAVSQAIEHKKIKVRSTPAFGCTVSLD